MMLRFQFNNRVALSSCNRRLVMDMLASGFWAGTMQGIRRLVEREPIRGPKSVCSLGGLISDIRATRGKLTREIYVKT